MKKILVSLLVLALCAPAMAADITIVDNGDCTATVTISDATAIVGLGLDVDVDAGAVTAVSVDTANFNINPDAAYTQELGAGYVYGTGTPVAAKTVPGEIALPQSSFALSFANLNGETTPGADGATSVSVTLTLSESATLTVGENATRGGIVATDGTGLDATTASLAIVCGGPLDCWDYDCQTLGDVDGDCDVDADDVTVAVGGWTNYAGTTTITAGEIENRCSDTDHDGDVDADDITDIVNGWVGGCGACTPL